MPKAETVFKSSYDQQAFLKRGKSASFHCRYDLTLFSLVIVWSSAKFRNQFFAEGSLTRLNNFSIFAISFSGPFAFS